MKIQIFPSGPFQTNAYILSDKQSKKGVIIDPSPNSVEFILPYLEENGITIEKILLTHSHWDHIGDVARLKEKLDIPVAVHPLDASNLERPGADGLPLFMPIEGVAPDEFLNDGDIIKVGEETFEVIHTPGHTPGGVCFYSKGQGILISGDTLFQGSIGNLSFPTSDAEAMWDSLKKLSLLPSETKVYPGHGPRTTIGDEPWLSQAKELFGY